MSLNFYNIKKWYKMLSGKSVLHVNQKCGTVFSKNEIRGYYNDLTQKVTMIPELLETNEFPLFHTEKEEDVYFPVAIFQYGLGAYDLYLTTGDKKCLNKFLQCSEWALAHQDDKGRWNNFFYIYPDNPYSAMAQGEAASLLTRAYKETKEQKYIDAAKLGLEYMLISVVKGGTTEYGDHETVLLEYTNGATVLNGWIFAWWGLYDYCLIVNNDAFEIIRDDSLASMIHLLPRFNNSYWSMYDMRGSIASPFYHHLHIAQMQAMYVLTRREEFKYYAELWQKRENSTICYLRAFIKKAWQKLKEKDGKK